MNELDDYLRTNRDAYTRDALTRRLIEAGHDPDSVESAWGRVGGPGDESVEPGPEGTVGVGTVLLAVAVFVIYGAAILAAALTIAYGGAVSILMIAYVTAMIVGLVVSIRRLMASPRRGAGWTPIWVATGLSVVIFVGLSGACFAALGPAINATGGLFGGR